MNRLPEVTARTLESMDAEELDMTIYHLNEETEEAIVRSSLKRNEDVVLQELLRILENENTTPHTKRSIKQTLKELLEL